MVNCGENVQNIDIKVYAQYQPSCGGGGSSAGLMDICYTTDNGVSTLCTTDVSLSGTYAEYTINQTTDSAGGDLDVTDIENLRIDIRRKTGGSPKLMVTEIAVDVNYLE